MSVYKRKDAWADTWRYRKRVTLPDGRSIRIAGTPDINTKRAAEEAERAHVERVLNGISAHLTDEGWHFVVFANQKALTCKALVNTERDALDEARRASAALAVGDAISIRGLVYWMSGPAWAVYWIQGRKLERHIDSTQSGARAHLIQQIGVQETRCVAEDDMSKPQKIKNGDGSTSWRIRFINADGKRVGATYTRRDIAVRALLARQRELEIERETRRGIESKERVPPEFRSLIEEDDFPDRLANYIAGMREKYPTFKVTKKSAIRSLLHKALRAEEQRKETA